MRPGWPRSCRSSPQSGFWRASSARRPATPPQRPEPASHPASSAPAAKVRARMSLLPFALHIPHVVEQAGSLAGFAAVIGLAVLSALYFSQARDLRRLREWAGRAPQRATEMGTATPGSPIPGRVVAVPQRPAPAATPAASPTAPVQPEKTDAAATNGDAAPSVVAAKPGEADAEKAEGEGEQKEGEEAKEDAAA